jgi:sec-independent protein translocase protein TatA
MMGLSFPHLALVAVVILVLFGRGRISEMMGDFGKGIKSFKEGMADETTSQPVTPPAKIESKGETVTPAAAPTEEKTGHN